MGNRLETIAHALAAEGKGILAADESLPTIQKRFSVLNIECTEETRRAYREMLFATDRIEEFISGVILFDETIRQKASSGRPFVDILSGKGIIPGIKVDKGTFAMPNFPGEKMTAGTDGLLDRLNEYMKIGAKFTKWRAVITIGPDIPTRACIEANAHGLALFAALSQEAGLVPVVEPEVLMDGDHDIGRCEEVTREVLVTVFDRLQRFRVRLEGMLLKPNMILSGKQSARQAGPSEVADRTIAVLRNTVPAAVPGVMFLSGGQTPEQATDHLNIMNARGPHPWELGFSFARALQDPALKTWKGRPENVSAARHLFFHRARCNGSARYGSYSRQMEQLAA